MPKGIKGFQRGNLNPSWLDEPGKAIHDWVRDNFDKPECCEFCGSKENLEWSNKKHDYKRNRKDWQLLCRSCHMKFDYKHNNRTKNLKPKSQEFKDKVSATMRGMSKTDDHRKKISEGIKKVWRIRKELTAKHN